MIILMMIIISTIVVIVVIVVMILMIIINYLRGARLRLDRPGGLQDRSFEQEQTNIEYYYSLIFKQEQLYSNSITTYLQYTLLYYNVLLYDTLLYYTLLLNNYKNRIITNIEY